MGLILSVFMRIELARCGDVIILGNHQYYNAIVTAHALLMIFLCAHEALFSPLPSQKSEEIHYSVKVMTNLMGKNPEGTIACHYSAMRGNHYPRSSIDLKLSWISLNWFKSNSCTERIAEAHCDDGRLFYACKSRRIFYRSISRTTPLVTHQEEMNEWNPKEVRRLDNETWGSPKGSNSYIPSLIEGGDGRPIVLAQLTIPLNSLLSRQMVNPSKVRLTGYGLLIPSEREGVRFYTSSIEPRLDYSGLAELEELRGTPKNEKFRNVYKLILNYDLHVAAYQKISSNKGSMTPGVDEETLDGISTNSIKEVILALKDHRFQFKPSRRIEIPKANGKKRYLGIPCPRDKVVQQVILMILEAIWEDTFLDVSHGFRKGRSTHTALKQISLWSGIDWFIEGDIQSNFDTIDHHQLEMLLKTRIEDDQFMNLYWKAVRAGYVEMRVSKKIDTLIGTPQGSIISPILFNIYLHELDELMTKECQKSKKSGTTSNPNKEYLKKHSRVGHLLKQKRLGRAISDSSLMIAKKERAKTMSKIKGEGYRIYYVRYADDFLIGIRGTYRRTILMKEVLSSFMKENMKLTLSWEKTKVTRSQHKVQFLGTEITRPQSRTKDTNRVKKKIGRRIFSARINATKLSLKVPVKKIVEKLSNQGFCEIRDYNAGKIIPKGKTTWMNLTLYDIIIRYGAVISGLDNYYSFADDRYRLQFIQYLLQHSAAKLIARKMKLHSRAQVFKRYGYTLKISELEGAKPKTIELPLRKSFKQPKNFRIKPQIPLETVY